MADGFNLAFKWLIQFMHLINAQNMEYIKLHVITLFHTIE